jgi:hypothetical protein
VYGFNPFPTLIPYRGLALGSGVMIAKESPMKNLEVKFSLSELEFRCKNLFLIWEKHWEARI